MKNDVASLSQWYQQLLGSKLAALECSQVAKALPTMFGYYLAYLGEAPVSHCLDTSPILRRIVVNQNHPAQQRVSTLHADYAELPFKSNSVDVLILQHVLEYNASPEAVLADCWRSLIPEGYMIILGFNPISLWGIRRLFTHKASSIPWSGKFLRMGTVKRYLDDLGCDIIDTSSFFYRPPIHHSYWLDALRFLEIIGQVCWPMCGAAYMLVAKKKLVTLTPIKPRIPSFREVLVKGVSREQPTTRRESTK